ncbi:MAG: hypothetical protein EOM44_15320 [Bacteroidia bacterium]|nr:hypothetical protein [Bacteroidia bacterium]
MKTSIKFGYSFIEDLKFVRNFVSKSYTRPILTGFTVGIKEGKVTISATDSYKLIDVIIGEIEDKETIYQSKSFPAEIIDFVVKIMKKAKSCIFSIDTDNDRVSFSESESAPEYSVTALQGVFPNIENLFKGIEQKVSIKKEWYQEFVYKYTGWDLHPTLEIDIKGAPELMYFQRENFDFIFKHFKGSKGEIFHANSVVKSILLTFDFNWKYRIVILPVRVGD